jgi:hypothetical protein
VEPSIQSIPARIAKPVHVPRCLAAVMIATGVHGLALAEPPTTQPAAGQLDEALRAYFTETSPDERRRQARKIDDATNGDVRAVASAIRRVELWERRPGGRERFTFAAAGGQLRSVDVHVPAEYDPARAYPLVLTLRASQTGDEGGIDFARTLLGLRCEALLVAAPQRSGGYDFDATPAGASEPVDLLHALRRRYHVDTDRVYAIGRGEGGSTAFGFAVLYSDWLAGAVSLSGTLVTPYPQQMREILMPNLAHTPVLCAWRARDAGLRPAGLSGWDVAGSNHHISQLAERLGLPLRAIELPGGPEQRGVPAGELIDQLLESRRDPDIPRVSHWFRYPPQGRKGWLHQAAFDGSPWSEPLLTILPAADTEFDSYVTKVLRGKLGYIGGRIEGQHIEVETANTAKLELRLHGGLVDFSAPLTVLWNGKTRLEAKVKPKVTTLLEMAYQDWEFQHLTTVLLTIDASGFARQE